MEPEVKQETQQKFERIIDLGDGEGAQRFEADTLEGLVDKLTKAQEHATRKIREQARQLKTGIGLLTPDPESPMPEWKPRKRTADEEWARTQEISDPAKTRSAIRSAVEDELGMSLDDLRETARAVEMAKRMNRASQEANQWAAKHKDDYYVCRQNYEAMMGYLEEKKMALTERNCDIAFYDLQSRQKLLAKPEAIETVEPEVKSTEVEERIAARPKSSGLRPSQSSGTVLARTPRLTWAEVNSWSDSVTEQKMRDPEIVKQMNTLDPRLRYIK